MYVVTLTEMFQFVNNLRVDIPLPKAGDRDTCDLGRLRYGLRSVLAVASRLVWRG